MAKNILWVEDRPDEITAVVTRLRSLGIEVEHAPSRTAAGARLDAGKRYGLVVLDALMADPEVQASKSGCTLFRDIRNGRWGEWGQTVPVMFVTNYAPLVVDLTGGIEPPPDDIIDKPLARDEGVERVLRCIDRITLTCMEGDEPQQALDSALAVAREAPTSLGRDVCLEVLEKNPQLVSDLSKGPQLALGEVIGALSKIERSPGQVNQINLTVIQNIIIGAGTIDEDHSAPTESVSGSQIEHTDIDVSGLDRKACESLAELVQKLIDEKPAEYMEAARRILDICAAEGNPAKTEQSVRSFRQWLSAVGEDVKNGIATAANLVAIAGPALKSLGL